MIIMSKDEKKMTKEEKYKVDVMKVICTLFNGWDLFDESANFDLREGSGLSDKADLFIRWKKEYDEKQRNKNFLPEKIKLYPGKDGYEEIAAALNDVIIKNIGTVNAKKQGRMMRYHRLDKNYDSMKIVKEGKKAGEGKDVEKNQKEIPPVDKEKEKTSTGKK